MRQSIELDMKTITDNKNEIFKRHEVVLEIESVNNPTFDDMRKKVSEKFNKPLENVNVYSIKGSFGANVFLIKAYIYDSHETLKHIFHLSKTKKQKKKESDELKKAAEEKIKAEKEATKVVAEAVQ